MSKSSACCAWCGRSVGIPSIGIHTTYDHMCEICFKKLLPLSLSLPITWTAETVKAEAEEYFWMKVSTKHNNVRRERKYVSSS